MTPVIENEYHTISLDHEWPVAERVDHADMGDAVVTMEVDTDLGTAVAALSVDDLAVLRTHIDGFITYYNQIDAGFASWN